MSAPDPLRPTTPAAAPAHAQPAGPVDRAVGALVDLATRAPRVTLGILALLTALSVWAATGLGIDTDSSRMLARDLPFQQRAEALNRAFPDLKNNLVIVLRGDIPAAVDAATAALAARLQPLPTLRSVFAPAADPMLRRNGGLYLDRAALSAQLSRLSSASNLIAALRVDPSLDGFVATLGQAAALARQGDVDAAALRPIYAQAAAILEDPAGAPPLDWTAAFAGPGERTQRVITVLPVFDYHALNPAKAAMQAVQGAIASLGPTPGVEIGLTGDPVLRAEELGQVQAGLGLGQALSVGMVALLLWLCLRSVGRSLLGLGTLTLSVALTAGFAAAAVGTLNLISVAFVVIMIGMGVDYALHFLCHVTEQRGLDARAALVATGQQTGGGLVLSVATTSVAFLAFATTDFVGMAQLGVIGGVGMILALGVTLTLIPAVAMLRPGLCVGPAEAPPGPARPWRPAAPRALAVGLGAIALVPMARFDADPMDLRDPDGRAVQVYRWLAEDTHTQPMRLSLLVPDDARAAAAAAALARLPQVAHAVWAGDLLPKEQEDKLALIDLAYPSLDHALNGVPVTLDAGADAGTLARELALTPGPEAAALARALARPRSPDALPAITAGLFAGLPDLLGRIGDLAALAPVGIDDLPAALRARYVAADGTRRVEITPRGDVRDPKVLADFVAAVSAVAPGVAGPPDQIVGAAGAVGGAILQAVGLIALASALMSWAVIRRIWAVVAIMLPLALAGCVTLAFGVLTGLPLNFANVIVLPLMIGIGIDSGVHIALNGQGGANRATNRAVLFSALTSIAAFGALGLSPHPGTASMGILLTVALLASLGMIFALTPAILALEHRVRRRSAAPSP